MKMKKSSRIKQLHLIVATLVLIGVAAQSVQGAVEAVRSGEDAWREHCGDSCPDPTGAEQPCAEDCLCCFCCSCGVNAWMLSSTEGLPAPRASLTETAPDELTDPKGVSIRIYHPPEF
jgi:hypothetical protein